jgi:formyltetrahydrofolate synthetase
MRAGSQVVYTRHTRERLHERGIAYGWVEAILDAPLIDQADPAGDGRRCCWGRASEFGDRMLRIVYAENGHVIRVITVTPDRNQGPRTP